MQCHDTFYFVSFGISELGASFLALGWVFARDINGFQNEWRLSAGI